MNVHTTSLTPSSGQKFSALPQIVSTKIIAAARKILLFISYPFTPSMSTLEEYKSHLTQNCKSLSPYTNMLICSPSVICNIFLGQNLKTSLNLQINPFLTHTYHSPPLYLSSSFFFYLCHLTRNHQLIIEIMYLIL